MSKDKSNKETTSEEIEAAIKLAEEEAKKDCQIKTFPDRRIIIEIDDLDDKPNSSTEIRKADKTKKNKSTCCNIL